MAKFVQETLVVGQDDFVSAATPVHKPGQRAVSDDGRSFRYAQAGAVALVAGNCVQSSAIVTAHLANTPPNVAIGATSFVYTPGAAAGAAGLYSDGFLQVDTTPGNGFTYGVSGHPAIGSSTAFTIQLKDPIQVALTAAASKVGLIANPYKGVIQMPATTATGTLVGVATYVIGISEWGWIQTWGICSVLIAGTPALGAIVMAPGATAGAAEIIVAAGNLIVAQIIGQMAQVGVSGKNNFVYLRINP
jgi:hypothetical protein